MYLPCLVFFLLLFVMHDTLPSTYNVCLLFSSSKIFLPFLPRGLAMLRLLNSCLIVCRFVCSVGLSVGPSEVFIVFYCAKLTVVKAWEWDGGLWIGYFWDTFGIVLGQFWNSIGIVFFDSFGILLEYFWDNFGIRL